MRRKIHTRLGVLLTAGGIYATGYAVQSGYELPFLTGASGVMDWGGAVCVALFFGWIGAQLPDMLEPSQNNPHHRGFFHSVLMLLALATLITLIVKGHLLAAPTLEGFYLRIISVSLLFGYETHLILDLFTASRLPLVFR